MGQVDRGREKIDKDRKTDQQKDSHDVYCIQKFATFLVSIGTIEVKKRKVSTNNAKKP